MSIIKVENLSRQFGAISAVKDVSFEVDEGTIFGFLGPNGAGKTTTINILCTLLSPSSGRTFISGYDCKKEPSAVRKSIGIVFQDTTLDKDLSAYENLLFHAYLYNVKRPEMKSRIHDALNFLDLYDRKDDLVKTFSGGMKRRLEVARGLIHKPKVLFLDEPTLGLDPQSRAHLWEFIVKLPQKHNVTIFMTTHYMEEAEVCNRIAIIDNGEIIARGTPTELKKTVGGDVIYIKTSDNTKAGPEIEKLFSVSVSEKNGELYLTVPRGDAFIPKIIRTIGERVLSVRLQRPTLNDVFLKLTGKQIREESISSSDLIETNAVYVIVAREFKKFVRDKSRLISTLARPLIWLFLVGGGMSKLVSFGTGVTYMQFIFPGILGMTILFSSIFSSISIIWDKEFGLMKEILVAPVSRFSIVIGKALSGTVISVLQTVIILMLFPFLGIELSILSILSIIGIASLLAFCISAIGIIVATFFESFESFGAIINFIVMPMFFLSGAMYPVEKLPEILKLITRINPLTYGVDALKHAIFIDSSIADFSIMTDLTFLVMSSITAVAAASFLFERKD
jgi:ABC-2 type transport system ATP-binding protein